MLQPFVIQDALKRKICHIHKLEYELKPLGKERGYPEFIDFEVLPKRVKEVCQKDLDQIISRKLESDYLERALARFKELGEKARRPEYAIEQFQDYLPGYYGHKGSEVILDVLNELYLQTGKVKHSSFKPLTAIEVLQQVLVPECGLRLIQQDYNEKNKNISLEEARKIMRGSTEFGNLMYPKEEDEIESDRKGILSNNDEHDSKYDGKEEYE
ncbi:hypothetical protein BDF20DRAFT_810946 [Mycotypha africana]|uniref:uncharacterized protein n=1 Tax=Mycotypha africana TaxID=64632 RepID=UPI002301D221|nr:uncharacterized protein BDF20DRAFT_810946 [Mycotypha africana]KAI8992034.1 hypothetical protein BDF20DRAFT_810946 [Mycotypha africana]